MSAHDEGWTRAELARWFVEHDEVDEAARVLEPGDELDTGKSDFLDLAAALARRGLSASYELHRVRVQPGQAVDASVGNLASGARKPPARTTPAPASAAKKTA
jgi:hypothetical protein